MDRANEERLAEIEFVCAGCGEVCLICDLETDVALTHCTECANKRIRELEQLLIEYKDRASVLQAQVNRMKSGRGPDDPKGCPAGHYTTCCGYHDECREEMRKARMTAQETRTGIDQRVHAAITSGYTHARQIMQITGYGDRVVDRSLQRLRRKGKIHYTGGAAEAGWRKAGEQ